MITTVEELDGEFACVRRTIVKSSRRTPAVLAKPELFAIAIDKFLMWPTAWIASVFGNEFRVLIEWADAET